MININSAQSQQKMFTHGIHARVVCQSAAIEHMDFVRDSYDFLRLSQPLLEKLGDFACKKIQ